jgi:ribose transport system substrate-binding protein
MRGTRTLVVLAAALVVLAGCTSRQSAAKGSTSSTTGTIAAITPSPNGAPPIDHVSAATQLAIAEKGRFSHPPTTPSPPVRGGNVWVIEAADSVGDLKLATAGAMEAGRTLGWRMTTYDAKGLPTNYDKGIAVAVKAHANGIVLVGVPCTEVVNALTVAKSRQIPVSAVDSVDCSQVNPREPSLITAPVSFGVRWTNYSTALGQEGSDLGAFLTQVASKHPPAQIALLNMTVDYGTSLRQRGLRDRIALQPAIDLDDIDVEMYARGPVSSYYGQAVRSALIHSPNLSAVTTAGPLTAGMVRAMRAAPTDANPLRAGDLAIAGAGGDVSQLRLVAARGGLDASTVWPWDWWGYAAIDSLNSALAHRPLRDEGLGYQLATGQNVASLLAQVRGGSWDGYADFRTVYERSWGVK